MTAPDPEPEPSAASPETPEASGEPHEDLASSKDTPSGRQQPPAPRAAAVAQPRAAGRPNWKTALDDPTAIEGKMEYVSYYLPRTLKLRFSAAMYWTARDRHIDRELPENMSKAIAGFIETFVSELERDYNSGEVFPPTPEQLKGTRRRKS
ncbi:hypothetical protein [Pseudonocardia dioxanivorans]|uniref:hypothetical protein n=1 Tax=Pseudonocardia dioxanivorans TaxID=240495 RepID=UPI001F3B5CB7|nr:hypothetical protein [Pseudonocardia dioxanivorans]